MVHNSFPTMCLWINVFLFVVIETLCFFILKFHVFFFSIPENFLPYYFIMSFWNLIWYMLGLQFLSQCLFSFLASNKISFFFHFKTTKFILSQESTVSVISGWEDIPSLVPHIKLPFPFSMGCCSSLNPSISYTGIMAMSVNTDQWAGNLENRFISVISYTNVLWEVNNADRFRQI